MDKKDLDQLVSKRLPYKSPAYDDAVVGAMKALLSGTANEGQQKTAVKYIIEDLCQYYDISFTPGDPRATDFAEGKRYVAAHIITLSKIIIGGKR